MYDTLNKNHISLLDLSGNNNRAVISVNSQNADIINADGVSVKEMPDAYDLSLTDDTNTSYMTYDVPIGEYSIYNYDRNLSELVVSISNDNDFQELKTYDSEATVIAGITSDTNRAYIYAWTADNTETSVSTVNRSGFSALLKAIGSEFGVGSVNDASVAVNSSSGIVEVNGDNIKLSEQEGAYVSTIDVNDNSIEHHSDMPYEIIVKNNSLTHNGDKITGNLSMIVNSLQENTTSMNILFALYDSDDRLVDLSQEERVIGIGNNYIDLGKITYSGLSDGKYYIKCFLWDSMDSMQPLSDAVEIEIK